MSAAAVERLVARVEMTDEPGHLVQHIGEDEGPAGDVAKPRADPPVISHGSAVSLYVRLAAQLRDGREIGSARRDFGIGLPARGLGAIWHLHHGTGEPSDDPPETHRLGQRDIEDAINQMLGRDPEQRRPPRLAWGRLIDALRQAGVVVSEEELIAAPLTVELDGALEAAIRE